jgi:hypothetical protein
LRRRRFVPIDAAQVYGTRGYLAKIIDLIQGCGFGVAVFSEHTPPQTLANIFFEIGLSYVFGKSVIIIRTEGAKIPSDFVRTEWLMSIRGDKRRLARELNGHLKAIARLGHYYLKLGDIAFEAEAMDFEMTFERYKQALLNSGADAPRRRLEELIGRLQTVDPSLSMMTVARTKLLKAMQEFVGLLPSVP